MLGQLLLLAQLTVVCDPADSLRPLAEEIAREEGIAVADSWRGTHSEYLIWVVEPGHLSDRVIGSFARAWRDRFPLTAVGLISGRSPEQARALWRRARNVRATPSAAFDATTFFSKQEFVEALKTSGYVTFEGHAGQAYLQLGSGAVLRSNELPPMTNLVMGTESCNVFRPWMPGSLALAFSENGAAAFAGYAYSPESGFLIGGHDGLPFRYTWPEFPIGRVVQLQNRGAMQAFATLPIYFLLGDPRIALAAQPPYRVIADVTSDGNRLIEIADAPRGLLPVLIRGGARYSLVEASGTAAAARHGSYNSRLQALDSGSDKFVLVDHTEGPLILRLHRVVPWWWPGKMLLVGALDTALVFFGGSIAIIVLVVAVGIAALSTVATRGATGRAVAAGVIAGGLLATLHLCWILARLGHITVISKPTSFNPIAILGTVLLTGSAGAMYVLATGKFGRIAAVLLATFPMWLLAVLHFVFTLSTNFTVFRPRVGESIYSHHMALTAACSAAILATMVTCVFASLRRLFAR